MSSTRQKVQYIFRHHEILTDDQNNKIYILVKRSTQSLGAIRETSNNDIYLDLGEIKDPGIIDTVYNMVKERKQDIRL